MEEKEISSIYKKMRILNFENFDINNFSDIMYGKKSKRLIFTGFKKILIEKMHQSMHILTS